MARATISRRGQFAALIKIGHKTRTIRALEISAFAATSASVNRNCVPVGDTSAVGVELIKFEVGNPTACAPRHSNTIARRNIRIGGVLINLRRTAGCQLPLLLRGRFPPFSLFRFHTHAPTTRRACQGGQFCQKQSDQLRCCAPAHEYSDGSAPCSPAWIVLLYRWRRRHEEYDGDYVHLHGSDGSFLRHSVERGYQTKPLVN